MDTYSHSNPSIARLFALSRDAVAGVRGGRVLFANEAAEKLFGADVRGSSLTGLLPELTPPPAGESFVTAAEIRGSVRTVTGVWYEDWLILTFSREENASCGVSPGALSQMRTAAFNLRFSADRLLGAERRDDPFAAIFFHSYHCLLHQIEQLSDLSALTRGDMVCRPQTLDLAKLVRDLVDSTAYFTSEGFAKLSCTVPEEVCPVTADPDRLEQLLLILLSNSLLHTPPEGHVRVTLRREQRSWFLSVDDDGEGMSGDTLGRVFSPEKGFSPEEAAAGAGMGLSIAWGLARTMGGAMVLQSDSGRGTRVRLTLPAANGALLRDAEPPAPRGPGRILTELSGVLPHEAYRSEDME